MNLQRLTDGITIVEFSPLQDRYYESRLANIVQDRSLSGTLYAYKFWTDKWRFEISLIIYVKSMAEKINEWFKDNTELTFRPDLRDMSTWSVTVHILNNADPMQQFGPLWKGYYTGTIILEQI